MRLGFAFAAAALVGALAGSSAMADSSSVYTDISGADIVALLDAQGYEATLTSDQDGDPLVMGTADGLKFRVLTYDCNNQAPKRCRSMQFEASFSLQHKPGVDDFKTMNDYNQKKVYGRAFIDENGDAAVDFVVDLSGGVLAANLMNEVGTWKTYVLDVFVQQLGWKVS